MTTRYLIDNDFAAIRRGEFVSADEAAGEFILTEDAAFMLPLLEDIAKANGLKLAGKNKAAKLTDLFNKLGELKMAEQNEKTMSEKIKDIVSAGIDAGDSDDVMLVRIVQTGAKFGAAKKMFGDAIVALGLRIAPKERKEQIEKLLANAKFAPESWADVQAAIDAAVKGTKDTTQKQALGVIRSYAKEHEFKLPKRTAEHNVGSNSYRDKLCDFIIANPLVSDDELVAWVTEKKAEVKNLVAIQAAAVKLLGDMRKFASAANAAVNS